MAGKYLEIYEEVKKDIVEGIYKTDEKLPSKRTMAERKGVSVITVEHAYGLLLAEGYIETRERSGYFVLFSHGDYFLGESTEPVKASGKGREKTIFVKSSETKKQRSGNGKSAETEFSAALYAKTVRRVLSGYENEWMEKSETFGTERLRLAISDYLLRSRHIRVSSDRIMIGAGAEYLYGMIVRCFGRDLIYGVETPGYQRVEEVYKKDGAKVEKLPLGKVGIKSEALWKSNADILHVTPYRSFPSGVTATPDKKIEYLKWAEQKDALIIEDDFESEFTPLKKAEDTIFSMDPNGRVLYVNTFTKTIGPSVRIAYMLIPEQLMNTFKEELKWYSCPVPTLEQYIVAELLENGDFERHINRVRRKNRIEAAKH